MPTTKKQIAAKTPNIVDNVLSLLSIFLLKTEKRLKIKDKTKKIIPVTHKGCFLGTGLQVLGGVSEIATGVLEKSEVEPHSGQNLAFSGNFLPQLEQYINTSFLKIKIWHPF